MTWMTGRKRRWNLLCCSVGWSLALSWKWVLVIVRTALLNMMQDVPLSVPVWHTVTLVLCRTRLGSRQLGCLSMMLVSVFEHMCRLLMMKVLSNLLSRCCVTLLVCNWLYRLQGSIANLLFLQWVSSVLLLSVLASCFVTVISKWLLVVRLRSLPTSPKLLRLRKSIVQLRRFVWPVVLTVRRSCRPKRSWPGRLASRLRAVRKCNCTLARWRLAMLWMALARRPVLLSMIGLMSIAVNSCALLCWMR